MAINVKKTKVMVISKASKAELSVGWVDPRVGLGWVANRHGFSGLGWVGLRSWWAGLRWVGFSGPTPTH